tara:strand:+ start:257 stop:622 length:366 start_codon:yes stop_codon:yes gene_type:complete
MKPLKNLMKNENAMLLGALILGILFADTLKPVANNMLGKLVLLLGICYLANKHVVLGLLGALLYISLNNTLLEGNEDEKDPAEDDETEVVEGPDGFKEGEGADGEAAEEEEPQEEEGANSR